VRERVFIPGRITDHNLLGPQYIANLQMSGSPMLVKAWLEGDWSVIAGAFFPEFSLDRHVVEPRRLPSHWLRFRACDWGSSKPFSVGWYAVSEGDVPEFPRGALIRYREWYGMRDGQPNEGVQMTAEQVGTGIAERDDDGYEFKYPHSVIDPSAFAENGGPSIAERMFRATDKRVAWREADNKRVAGVGAIGGWDQVRARLVGYEGRPMLYFFSTCVHAIRTLPMLQHDQKKAEDVDSDGEDHAPDEIRYACMSRPYLTKPRAEEKTIEEQLMGVTMGARTKATMDKRRREREEMRI